jgi:ribose-phosphate pyrophosphokinase
VANLITAAGANRVLTMDLHASQIQGFFDIPVDHLYAINTLCEYFSKAVKFDPKKLVVVSPDIGSLKMARAYSKRLDAQFAVVDKRRASPEKIEVMNILGNVKGKIALLVDDIVATASSLVEAAEALGKEGVTSVYGAISHGILSGDALEKIRKCQTLKQLFITDSIPFRNGKANPKIKQVSVAPLLAEAIHRIHDEESVSCLFDEVRS